MHARIDASSCRVCWQDGGHEAVPRRPVFATAGARLRTDAMGYTPALPVPPIPRHPPKSRVAISLCAGRIGVPRDRLLPWVCTEPGEGRGCVFRPRLPRRAGFGSSWLSSLAGPLP